MLIADNLCDDIETTIANMFADKNVQSAALKWIKKQAPIQGI
jgi:hypothetical protein